MGEREKGKETGNRLKGNHPETGKWAGESRGEGNIEKMQNHRKRKEDRKCGYLHIAAAMSR